MCVCKDLIFYALMKCSGMQGVQTVFSSFVKKDDEDELNFHRASSSKSWIRKGLFGPRLPSNDLYWRTKVSRKRSMARNGAVQIILVIVCEWSARVMDMTEEKTTSAITCPSCRISIVPSRARTMCPFCGSFYNRAANNDVSLRRRSTDEPVRLPQLVENGNVSFASLQLF